MVKRVINSLSIKILTYREETKGREKMKILLVVISIVVLFSVLTIGILKGNHKVRYANGYDNEIENDYQTMIQLFSHAEERK